MREKTKGNLFRSVLSIALAIVLFLGVALVFAGCDEDDEFYDPENPSASPSFFERYVGGFNTVFANDSSGYGGIDEGEEGVDERDWATYKFKIDFFDALTYFFAYRAQGLPDSFTELNNKFSAFYDSNRALVYQKGEELEFDHTKHWNWSINPFISGASLFSLNDIVQGNNQSIPKPESIETWNLILAGLLSVQPSYNFNIFNNVLQIVLYEIMLGYTDLTTVSVEIDYGEDTTLATGTYSIVIDYCNDSSLNNFTVYSYTNKGTTTTSNNTGSLREYNEALQAQYENQTRYTGFTKDNADRFITYILDEVIGTDIVRMDYNDFRDDETNFRNYVEVVTNIVYELTYDGSGDSWVYSYSQIPNYTVEFDITDEIGNLKGQTDFTAKPATFVRYYPGETFFEPYEVEYAFANVPVGEYQSILVVPAESNETAIDNGLKLESGFIFNFMSKNKDLKINTKIRYQYYNEETGYRKLFEFDCDQVNFENREQKIAPDGSIYYENDFEFAINPEKDLPPEITNEESGSYKTITYTVGFFKNKKLLDNIANETEVSLSNPSVSEIQDLYKVIPSKNGFGGITVLNEKKINSSFFEIVLDVVKSPTDPKNTDYNFALILVPIFGIL